MSEVSIDQAKETLPALLEAVAKGEEIIIRDNHLAAKLSPIKIEPEEAVEVKEAERRPFVAKWAPQGQWHISSTA